MEDLILNLFVVLHIDVPQLTYYLETPCNVVCGFVILVIHMMSMHSPIKGVQRFYRGSKHCTGYWRAQSDQTLSTQGYTIQYTYMLEVNTKIIVLLIKQDVLDCGLSNSSDLGKNLINRMYALS